jgi:hypothetical protein
MVLRWIGPLSSSSNDDRRVREGLVDHTGRVAMKTMLGFLMVVGLALGGCGNNDCEDAADKVKECGITNTSGSGDTSDCSGKAECNSKCINDASCDEMKTLDLNGKFLKCVAACG